MAYPRFTRSRQLVKARRTSGNLTLNSTSWANVDTGLDLVLNEVQVGDEIVYGISVTAGNEGVEVYLDVATIVAAAPVNHLGSRGAAPTTSSDYRIGAWRLPSGSYQGIGGTAPPYTVVAGDLSGGTLTLRLRYLSSTAANKTLLASTVSMLDVWAMNLGPAQA